MYHYQIINPKRGRTDKNGEITMIKRIVCILIVLLLLISVNSSPAGAAKKKIKDKDLDGVPDHLDNEILKTNPSNSNTSSLMESSAKSSGSLNLGNWSISYGSSDSYGPYVRDVKWNNTYFINYANIPWIEIDSNRYELPNDFDFHGANYAALTNYYLVYQLYSIEINEFNNSVEILWYFWKDSVNNSGKLNVSVLHSVNDNLEHELFVPFRFDFDIVTASNDYIYTYGTDKWNPQASEAFQYTYTPVDKIWGMKVKQQDGIYTSTWAGIKAWSTNEINYLLKYVSGELKGSPENYVDDDSIEDEDDVIWTTAYTAGSSPIWCGPDVFLH
jgi:hypothetical protein